ncbi:MAG: hypothetical protein HQ534_00805 [Armatimonadetes bacterium]|nr:hypothetical protein [Armatimonadota bacterium]
MDKIEMSSTSNYNWKFFLKLFVSIVIGLATLLGFLFVFNDFLDNKIENKITDNEYIYKLSKTLRPFCIFYKKDGVIFYDHGIYKVHIDSIEIKYNTSKKDRQNEIYVYTKNYLQIAPLVEYIGPNAVVIFKPKRLKNNVWLYNFKELGTHTTNRQFDEFFRLEILK